MQKRYESWFENNSDQVIDIRETAENGFKVIEIKSGEGNSENGYFIHLSDNFKKCFKEAFLSEYGDKTFVLIMILVISQCNDTLAKKKEEKGEGNM